MTEIVELCTQFWKMMCSTYKDYAYNFCKLCVNYACHLSSYLLDCWYTNTEYNSQINSNL